MMRNTEKTALLNIQQGSINGRDMARPGCLTSTTRALKNFRHAINRPIKKYVDPKMAKANRVLSYADPLVNTLLGLGVYDAILTNAIGFPSKYQDISNGMNVAAAGYLLINALASWGYETRNPDYQPMSGIDKRVLLKLILDGINNGASSLAFTLQTLFALSLDKTDPNDSTPSDSNIDIYYNFFAASLVVGLTAASISFAKEYIQEYEKKGRVFAKTLRDYFNPSTKLTALIAYKLIDTGVSGSQFDGGSINQATADSYLYFNNETLEYMAPEKRTAIFIGGHAAGFALALTLLLLVNSEEIKKTSDLAYNILAAAFFAPELFVNLVNSLDGHQENNGLAITALALNTVVFVGLVAGTIYLGHRKYHENNEQKELVNPAALTDDKKDSSTNSADVENQMATSRPSTPTLSLVKNNTPTATQQTSVASQGLFSGSKKTSSSDVLPVDDEYIAWLQQNSNLSASFN